jgi:hypothetical protein
MEELERQGFTARTVLDYYKSDKWNAEFGRDLGGCLVVPGVEDRFYVSQSSSFQYGGQLTTIENYELFTFDSKLNFSR